MQEPVRIPMLIAMLMYGPNIPMTFAGNVSTRKAEPETYRIPTPNPKIILPITKVQKN